MLKSVPLFLANKLINFLEQPKIRYKSDAYRRLQNALSYDCKEQWYDTIMAHLRNCQMQGDYYEFGVFQGRSLVYAWYFAKNYGLNDMHFYGFDSFAGLPDSKIDKTSDFTRFDEGNYSCGMDSVINNLKARDVNLNDITLIPGYYKDSLNKLTKQKLRDSKAAVILIDSDIYESAMQALEFCTDYIQDGTIIMFDEFYAYKGHPQKGERKALTEWCASKRIEVTQFYSYPRQGQSFIVHR